MYYCVPLKLNQIKYIIMAVCIFNKNHHMACYNKIITLVSTLDHDDQN